MLPAVPVNELFNTENAEIVLRSAFVDSAKSALGKTEVSTDFRLQKEQLARISEIFRDMLQLGGSDESSGDECPIVQVEEGTAIVEEILRLTARDDVGAYSRLGDMEPRLLVSVWKASDKYKIPDLEFITEIFIAKRLNKMDAALCSIVYTRAVLLNRTRLRESAARRLASFPTGKWSTDVISNVDPYGAVMELFAMREAHRNEVKEWKPASQYVDNGVGFPEGTGFDHYQ